MFVRTADVRLLLSLRLTTTTRLLLLLLLLFLVVPPTVVPLNTVRVLPDVLIRLFELATLVRVGMLVRTALVRNEFSALDEKLLRVPLAAATALVRANEVPPPNRFWLKVPRL